MMYGSTQGPEADVQGGQVKIHEDTSKMIRKGAEKKAFLGRMNRICKLTGISQGN